MSVMAVFQQLSRGRSFSYIEQPDYAAPVTAPSTTPPSPNEPILRTDSSVVRGCLGTATNCTRSAGHIHATAETTTHRSAFAECERRLLICINPESNPPAAARTGRTSELRSRIRTRSANRNGVVIPIVDAHIQPLVASNHFRAINHWANPTLHPIPAPR